MNKRSSGVALIAVALAAISAGIFFNATPDASRPSRPLVSVAPASDPVKVSDHSATNNNRPAPNNNAKKPDDPHAATCDNPVVTFTEPVSLELKNKALIDADQALKKFEQENGVVATAEQRDAFFSQVAELLPTEMTTEIVFDNNEESHGDREAIITDEEANPSDKDYARLKNRVKQAGCEPTGGGATFVSYSTTTYNDSVGWKSCTKTVSFSALNGIKVAQLRLVSEWYNTVYLVPIPSMIEGRATSTAYWVWKKDGEPTLSIGRPYYQYPTGGWYAYQNRAWANYKYEVSANIGPIGGTVVLDRGSLYASHVFGPGGKCV